MNWPLRIALARFRPVGFALFLKLITIAGILAAFLALDYIIFLRLFRAAARIEELTPFFAIGLITNFLGLVFLIALFVLFFSALTSSIPAFFTDLDLELYHAAPRRRIRVAAARLGKAFIQSAWVVVIFLVPVFFAFAEQFKLPLSFVGIATVNLLILLITPVSLAALLILLLVRYFPVRRVHQIAATLAIIFLTLVIVGIRVARPERLFTEIGTDDVVQVLRAIELPAAERYPSNWLAVMMGNFAEGLPAGRPQLQLALLALFSVGIYLLVASRTYFPAFVRSRETSAPAALGGAQFTGMVDRIARIFGQQVRSIFGKEVRMVTRDAAQWSQLFMLVALLFMYLYNIQMMPLEGDARAAILAYLNLGMAGFVIAAICLRFAYPSVSAEGKQFWIVESAPISYRKLLWVKTLVYLIPLLFIGLLLIGMANVILDASAQIWWDTMAGSVMLTTTLVSLGVAMGAMTPNFKLENPIEAALSLGGLAYMALSMIYAGFVMFMMARRLQRILMRVIFGLNDDEMSSLVRIAPVMTVVLLSLLLTTVPIEIAARRMSRRAVSS